MSVTQSITEVTSISKKAESIFSELDTLFPQLLDKSEKTSFHHLLSTIESLQASIASSKDSAALATFGEKYNPVFEKLNEKIEDLNSLDKMIAEIKEDSEQMELIALNAMVISVKSGEKGLAFSKITENLQRLSKDMFTYSDKLSAEEKQLLEDISSLKVIFSGILDAQKSIAAKDSECTNEMNSLVSKVTPAMEELRNEAGTIYPTIEQTRDSVHQNSASILSSLQELSNTLRDAERYESTPDAQTRYIEKAKNLASTISNSMGSACQTFAGNWSEVIEILDKADGSRMDFEGRFLNRHAFGNDNIERSLESIVNKFRIIINEFNKYYTVQKDLEATCQGITSKAKAIYSVFENLRPVMSRLHHVRILQQIEVSKNEAITSVQDSVTDMDNLINAANKSLDGMESVLESFIHDTSTMLSNFVLSIHKDNDEMTRLKADKETCYSDLTNGQSNLVTAIQNFTVFPNGFQNKCVQAQQNLQDFMRLNAEIGSISDSF
ncbi:MAG: hypothetical protein IJ630_09835 [Treponema sp.]|nr:hypothetical protein [Treponema sp.]